MDQNKNQPTIEDIAKTACVSIQNVSRLITGRNDVASKIRERIQEIIKELNYHLSAIAPGLLSQRSYTTISQNLEQSGRVAVWQLARIVEESNSESEIGQAIYFTLKPEIIVRKSFVPVSL